jgi:steroid 5-alpha reductase family enzyme
MILKDLATHINADFAGGTNFAVLGITTLALSTDPSARQILVTILLSAWALRLSGFLLFRILKTGHDDRFNDMRGKFFPFLGFWVFQMIWVWTVSLPVTLLNSPTVRKGLDNGGSGDVKFGTARDIAGLVLWGVGFVMESVSDVEKFRFRSMNKDSAAVCDKGFWKVSRHPNYFGDIIIQFGRSEECLHSPPVLTRDLGIYTITTSVAMYGDISSSAKAALYASVVGAVFLTVLLMFVSGLPLSERPAAKKRYERGQGWGEYQRYLHRTSILIPFPPALYEKMPTFLRRTVFLEFPMYVFDPAKHSDQAKTASQRGDRAGSGEDLVRSP